MAKARRQNDSTARIESLKVSNFRALQSLELNDLTPFTALLGPNGSGKTTVFDVFNFLSECFQKGLRSAWDSRGRAREIKTRDQNGPVVFEIKYRERKGDPLMSYHLALDEIKGKVVVEKEWLAWRREGYGKPFRFLEYSRGIGKVASGDLPDAQDTRIPSPLTSPDLLAVNAIGQMAEHPRVAALRNFITDWHVSYLSINDTRELQDAGPQERLSKSGGNLANVIQYFSENHPKRLEHIFDRLRERVPRVGVALSEPQDDGRLLLQIKDAPFARPILARFASDGTLKLLAYLILLHDAEPPQFIGIEEPENFLHPKLLPILAEECRAAAESSQVLVTTHSPFFVNAMQPDEVRVLYRNKRGYTESVRAVDCEGVTEQMEQGAQLGELWMEDFIGAGNPLVNGGMPRQKRKGAR